MTLRVLAWIVLAEVALSIPLAWYRLGRGKPREAPTLAGTIESTLVWLGIIVLAARVLGWL